MENDAEGRRDPCGREEQEERGLAHGSEEHNGSGPTWYFLEWNVEATKLVRRLCNHSKPKSNLLIWIIEDERNETLTGSVLVKRKDSLEQDS